MSTGNEDFEKLRKLLALKRYEIPPPGYLGRFSGLVVNRIEQGGASEPTSRVSVEAPWLQRFLGIFESSPVAAGIFGSAACALAIFAIAAANHVEKAPSMAFSTMTGAASDANLRDSRPLNNAANEARFGSSTDPMFASNAMGVAFGSSLNARIEPASFSPIHPQ